MVRAVVVAVLMTSVVGCRGPRAPQPPSAAPACLRAPAAAGAIAQVHGRIVDEVGRPVAGARIEAGQWERDHGAWSHATRATTMSDDAGGYVLAIAYGDYILRVGKDGRDAVVTRLRAGDGPARRLDVTLDTSRAPGIVAIVDARTAPDGSPPDCEWVCPRDRAPAEGWWLRETPCPLGARLALEFHDDDGTAIAACRTDAGVLHGAYARWTSGLEGGAGADQRGWYAQGERCGEWLTREGPPPPATSPEPPPSTAVPER